MLNPLIVPNFSLGIGVLHLWPQLFVVPFLQPSRGISGKSGMKPGQRDAFIPPAAHCKAEVTSLRQSLTPY